MAILATSVPESVRDHASATAERDRLVTTGTRDADMRTVEREPGALGVRESLDGEALAPVAVPTASRLRPGAELTRVRVGVAALALTRNPAIARNTASGAIPDAGRVTSLAHGTRMRSLERPARVVEERSLPAFDRMAACAPSLSHLRGELFAVRILVALGTRVRRQLEGETRALDAMATSAGHGLVTPCEGKRRAPVHRHVEAGRCEPPLVVACTALACFEVVQRAPVRTRGMATAAASSVELAKASVR